MTSCAFFNALVRLRAQKMTFLSICQNLSTWTRAPIDHEHFSRANIKCVQRNELCGVVTTRMFAFHYKFYRKKTLG